jgi:hypothetical protein
VVLQLRVIGGVRTQKRQARRTGGTEFIKLLEAQLSPARTKHTSIVLELLCHLHAVGSVNVVLDKVKRVRRSLTSSEERSRAQYSACRNWRTKIGSINKFET